MNLVLLFYLVLVNVIRCQTIGDRIISFIKSGLSDMACTEQVAVTVGVVSRGNVIVAKTMGTRDIENDLRANDKTLFGIGSTSKAMTAIITKKVLEEMNYTWDTPISKIYPDFKLNCAITDRVSFRDLYSHRTCVRRDDFWWTSGPETFDLDVVGKKMKDLLLIDGCEFRKDFNYNNLLYVYGAYVIEKISGKPWAQLIQEKLFNPLGMMESKPYFREAKKTDNWVVGYDIYEGVFKPLPHDSDKIIDLVGQAGSIHSTPGDMVKYLKYLLENKDTFKDLFWEETVDIIKNMAPVNLDKGVFPVTGSLSKYSVAWALGDYREGEIMAHGGTTFTTHTFITISREHDYGIFLSNTGSGKAKDAVQLLTWYIQDLLLGKEPWLNATTYCSFPEPWKKQKEEKEKDLLEGFVISSKLMNRTSYIGVYEHPVFGNSSITLDGDGSLFFQFNKINCTLYVKEKTYDTFRCLAFLPWMINNLKVSPMERLLHLAYNNTGITFSSVLTEGYSYKFVRSGGTQILKRRTTFSLIIIGQLLLLFRTFL